MDALTRIRNLVTRFLVTLATPARPNNPIASVQARLLDDELQDLLEHLQSFGFASVPLPGAEGVALAVLGQSGHRVAAVIMDRRYQPTDLIPGETALFNAFGCRVTLRADGVMQFVAPAGFAFVAGDGTGTATLSGSLIATGQVQDANGSMQEMRNIYNSHNHGGAGPNTPMT